MDSGQVGGAATPLIRGSGQEQILTWPLTLAPLNKGGGEARAGGISRDHPKQNPASRFTLEAGFVKNASLESEAEGEVKLTARIPRAERVEQTNWRKLQRAETDVNLHAQPHAPLQASGDGGDHVAVGVGAGGA